ncbi:MAG: TonB family protein [Bacteroidia bacterium]|nr:TonB family protein [Bacteroidia bacterium]MDW8158985.1 TonB family protein [Bacteroidia bacterium]
MKQVIIADLDEIVFRPRNKEYGAYVLRKASRRSTLAAFVIGVGVLGMLIGAPLLADWISRQVREAELQLKEAEAKLTEPPPLNKDEKLPEQINEPPPPPPKRSEVQFIPPEVVKHEEAPPEQTIVEVQKLDTMKADISDKNVKGSDDAPPDISLVESKGTGTKPVEVAPPPKEEEPDPNAFIQVEQQPAPVNLDDIKRKIEYPAMCKEAGIQGKVFIRILVNKEGIPEKHIVQKTPHPLLAEECLKHIYNLRFKPGIQAGKPIKVWVSIPFDFKLK